MDYEKYYLVGSDGSYHLHFFNTKGLTMDDIKNIFSPYGNVANIKIGEKSGFRFVKYNTLDETIRCLKGLQNSDVVQLLPQKTKINGSNRKMDQSNFGQQQIVRTENSSHRTFKTKKFNSASACNGKTSDINERSNHNLKTFNSNDKFDDVDDFSETNSQNSRYDHKDKAKVIKQDKSDSLVLNEKHSLSSKQNSIDMSSDTIMKYEKYYRISKDGTYALHFPNKKGLSMEEIKELFSLYGNVLSVYSGGDNNGLRFVRYKTLDEIIKCLKGLENSTVINILPQKNKINNIIKKVDQKNLNQRQFVKAEDSSEHAFNTSKQFNSGSIPEKFPEVEEKQTYNSPSIKSFCRDNGFNDNMSDSSNFRNSKYTCNTGTNKTNDNELNVSILNGNYPLSSRQVNSIPNGVPHYDKVKKQQKMHSYFSTNSDIPMNQDTSDINEIPKLISDTEIKQKKCDATSDSSILKNKNSIEVVIPIQGIVVANIHENYGIHYILHLFEKYNPISATLVNTSETDIRYCCVYFKTAQDEIGAEEEFDNFELFGKRLIVLRQSQLIKKAYCK